MKASSKHDDPGKPGRDGKHRPKRRNGAASRSGERSLDIGRLRGLLPPLSAEEYEELKESIRRHKTVVPSIVDADGNVIDGEHRERACKELGIDCPQVIQDFESETEKLLLAVNLNVNRRHLTGKQKRELIALCLEIVPGINDRHLGDVVGVSKTTVAAERHQLEATGQIDQLPQRLGRDGKLRPAKYRQIIANNAKEAEEARRVIKGLPSSCEGKLLDVKTAARSARRHASKRHFEAEIVVPSPDDVIRLCCCRFQELEERAGIVPSSVHALITDILYDGKFVEQVSGLAAFAARILVPGGLFVTLSGTLYLDQVMECLGKNLKWGWMGTSVWDGKGTLVHQRQVMSQWKPVLVYSKGPWQKRGMWPDVFRVNSQEKDWHPMQQPLEEAEMFVKYFSQLGDLVVDCCAGSFTTALACRNLGRRFIGCDPDKVNVSKGQARLAGLTFDEWARQNQVELERHEGNGQE